jgi:peptide/nickel transport system substrate-binding protein
MFGAMASAAFAARPARAQTSAHAIAMHGAPAWGPGFRQPTYANPAAPKGGQLVQGVLGTFDSLNPFIVRGLPAVNLRSYVVESLRARGYDEPFTLYGLIAQSVEADDARDRVTFTIKPAARFADGRPVTPDAGIFSWQVLRVHGRPN